MGCMYTKPKEEKYKYDYKKNPYPNITIKDFMIESHKREKNKPVYNNLTFGMK